jgi:hypothetical protein
VWEAKTLHVKEKTSIFLKPIEGHRISSWTNYFVIWLKTGAEQSRAASVNTIMKSRVP